MNDSPFYQQKPILEQEKKSARSIGLTFFSMALFVLTYCLFIDSDLIFISLIVGVLFIHELGHFLFMKLFGYENVRMLFVPLMGAFVHGKKESYTQWQQVLVVIAGPIPGIIFGLICWYIGFEYAIDWLASLSCIFLVLNALNLLPVQPLDGGKLFQILFLSGSSLVPVVFTLLSSLTIIAFGFYFQMYLLMGIGFFMAFQVRNQYRSFLIHKSLNQQNVNFTGTYDELSNGDYHFIKIEMLANTPGLRKYIDLAQDQDTDQLVAQEVKALLKPLVTQNVSVLWKIILLLVWTASIVFPAYLLIKLMIKTGLL